MKKLLLLLASFCFVLPGFGDSSNDEFYSSLFENVVDQVIDNNYTYAIVNNKALGKSAVLLGFADDEVPSNIIDVPEFVVYKNAKYPVKVVAAFSNCDEIKSVKLSNSVEYIGNSAFSHCDGLTEITIGNSVTYIGDGAFSNCRNLTEITIGNSVTYIGDGAFSNCRNLTEITIGNSVTHIGNNAFSECDGLTGITIGNSVTHIGDWAFSECDGLTEITIGNSVTHIGDWAFSECDGLTEITMGNSVTHIGDYAFYNGGGTGGLAAIKLSSTLEYIGDYAFRGVSISGVIIPPSVKYLGDNAFLSGFNDKIKRAYPNHLSPKLSHFDDHPGAGVFLKDVPYDPNQCVIEDGILYDSGKNTIYFADGTVSGDIVIPSSVNTIKESSFRYCNRINSVDMFLPSPGKKNRVEFRAFDCSVEKVVIRDRGAIIDEYAFGNRVKYLSIGGVVEKKARALSTDNDADNPDENQDAALLSKAFSNMTELIEIEYAAKNPVSLPDNIFASEVYQKAKLIVPTGTLELAKNTMPWKNFVNIEEKIFSGITDAVDDTDNENIEIYNICGEKITTYPGENLPRGIYISRRGTEVRKIIVR